MRRVRCVVKRSWDQLDLIGPKQDQVHHERFKQLRGESVVSAHVVRRCTCGKCSVARECVVRECVFARWREAMRDGESCACGGDVTAVSGLAQMAGCGMLLTSLFLDGSRFVCLASDGLATTQHAACQALKQRQRVACSSSRQE